jgi:hypothetical protein
MEKALIKSPSPLLTSGIPRIPKKDRKKSLSKILSDKFFSVASWGITGMTILSPHHSLSQRLGVFLVASIPRSTVTTHHANHSPIHQVPGPGD